MSGLGYKPALTKNFLRELKKLPREIRPRVLTAIDEITARPFSGIRLRGELQGRFRWRVGRYRVIYVIDDKPKLVVFLDIGHRKSVYEA